MTLTISIGVFQGWLLVRFLAVPLALLFWWFDGSLTRTDRRLERLYGAVFEGRRPPPLMGDESATARRLPEAPRETRRALVSGPGSGLHLMMAGVALVFNILV